MESNRNRRVNSQTMTPNLMNRRPNAVISATRNQPDRTYGDLVTIPVRRSPPPKMNNQKAKETADHDPYANDFLAKQIKSFEGTNQGAKTRNNQSGALLKNSQSQEVLYRS